ncbi:hypothetical protein [Bacteroides heparinolyticus]|uniref:hypothetical protein n=1 Tax=Prevotella heparinolytica TaxID=28113 RepID=UPI0035A0B49B
MKVQKKVSTKLIGFAKHLDGEESYERYLKTAQEKKGVVCAKCSARNGTETLLRLLDVNAKIVVAE